MQHWRHIKTDNTIERLNREIRRETRVVGTFPDAHSALMLATERCKYIAQSSWGGKTLSGHIRVRRAKSRHLGTGTPRPKTLLTCQLICKKILAVPRRYYHSVQKKPMSSIVLRLRTTFTRLVGEQADFEHRFSSRDKNAGGHPPTPGRLFLRKG